MEQEWINVADTAVKIGLGALITGLFTLVGMKVSAKSENRKFMLEHKVKILENLAADIDVYFNACSEYMNIISGTSIIRNDHHIETECLSPKQILGIEKKDENLISCSNQLKSAVSKLKLIKEKTAAEELIKYSEFITTVRDPISFGRRFPMCDEFELLRKKHLLKQHKVHTELSKIYEQLSN